MKNLTEAIKTTVCSQLECNQEVHPRMIEAVVREQYGDLIKEHGEVLAYRALLRQIKNVLKTMGGDGEETPVAQLSLPGMRPSITALWHSPVSTACCRQLKPVAIPCRQNGPVLYYH